DQVAVAYTRLVQALNTVAGQLATRSSNGDVTRRAAGLQSLNAAVEAMSQQRGIVYRALQSKNLTGSDYTELASANAASQLGITGYLSAASDPGRALYQSSSASTESTMIAAVLRRIDSTRSVTDPAITSAQWLNLTGVRAQQLQQVQADQAAGLSGRIHSLAQSARTGALVSAGLIYLILSFALLATLLVARSILRPLRALRSAALDVAYQRLPGTVRRLEDSDVDADALAVAPIGVGGPDEIGQVGRAFDAVHSEAVRLAGQQALMRGNVSKMFTNLSRRSQNLVERQLRLIDELEAGEQDADQLANLFRLDHLATRMRRNDENLLVLAGAEGGRRRSEPVPMLDVLRAASAEVEQYARVKLQVLSGYLLTGPAVNDVVHLVAELVENATTFSSPSTSVLVRSRSLGTGGDVMIEVEDHGIGMSPSELAAANQKLATPSGMDVSMSQLMGLFVVARLAVRHGIDVQLRPAQTGGLIALVRLPAALITAPIESVPTAVPVRAAGQDLVGSPIFDALQSEWFTGRGADLMPPLAPAGQPLQPTAQQPTAQQPPSNWRSPGDDGWLAAASLATPNQPAAVTPAGLPVRVPGRNLIPGSAAPTPVATSNGSHGRPAAKLPRALSGYQRGVRRARDNGQSENGQSENSQSENGQSETGQFERFARQRLARSRGWSGPAGFERIGEHGRIIHGRR
ncbi:MAG: nitrate- and nitrite sensing domain-containing protein, partial [Jatrophihabitantaceae bacterium]